MNGLRVSCALGALVASTVFPAAAALAQAADSTQVGAGDIIVTATRRAQALSDVPIAVSAISSQQLEASGVNDIRALNQLAPSLLVSGATSETNFTARVRGVGTVGENPGLESSVALFIDGVYRSRTGTGLSELGEVERIEVLRGPQGTLFGRNASAGLINIVTKKPSFDNGGYAAASYGNYNSMRLEGGVNYVLADNIAAAKLEGLWFKRDGFVEDIRSDRDFNDRDRWMLRGQLLLTPNDNLEIRLIGDYSRRREQCCVASYLSSRSLARDAQGNVIILPNTLEPILRGLGVTSPRGELFKVAVSPNRDYRSDSDDWGVSGEVNWDLGAASLTSITAWRDYRVRTGQDSDFTDIDFWGRSDQFRHFKTFSQELRLQGTLFEDRLDWLVGAYFADEKLFTSDNIAFGADSERYGDCLIVASLAPTTLNPSLPRCTTLPATSWPGYAGLAAATGTARMPGTGAGGYMNHESRNYAFFTHNSFDIVPDKLILTVGARYTNERKTIDGVFANNNTLCAALRNIASAAASVPCAINGTAGTGIPSGSEGARVSESRWTGTVVLSWKPVDDLMVYGSWARGYKAGGFNLDTSALDIVCNPNAGTVAQRAACSGQLALPANTVGNARPEAIDLQFGAETVDSWELGAKFSRPGFSANLALFQQKFSNFQLNTFNGVNFEVTNIQGCRDDLGNTDSDGSATTGACSPDRLKPGLVSKGIELELNAQPAPYFNVTAGLTYTDTRYAKDLVGTGGRPLSPVLFQLPGRLLSNAPAYVMSGSISWNPPIGDNLRGLAYLDYRFTDSYNTGSDLDLEKVQEAYILFNGRVGISSADRKWSLELWGQNLFNKQYFQISADAPLQGSGTFRGVAQGISTTANQLFLTFPGEPRTFGVTGRFRF
ncbi:TonB-dependent receptor [Sandaracinobacter sp.]|uniref:TonB-dependent receptor n=1 Tax=Sandaracinobacter sp. TaxID=2487581 RepID=UPI0035AF5AD5